MNRKNIEIIYNPISCILCGNEVLEKMYSRKNYHLQTITHTMCVDLNYQICPVCGLTFMSPQIATSCWLEYYNSINLGDGLQESKNIAEIAKIWDHDFYYKYFRPNDKVFDIGHGQGKFLYLLEEKYQVKGSGLETSKSLHEYVKKTYKFQTICSTFEDAELLHDYYDVVTSRHVFEHLENPLLALKKAKKMIHDDGILLVEVPSAYYPIDTLRDSYCSHNFLFTPVTFERMARLAGLEVIEIFEHQPNFTFIMKKGVIKSELPVSDYQETLNKTNLFFTEYNTKIVALKERVQRLLNRWQKEHTRIAIYGAGEHSLSLFEFFDFSNVELKFFLDSNPALAEYDFYGYDIFTPDKLDDNLVDEVLISSCVYEDEIAKMLNEKYPQLKHNKIYDVDDGVR